MLRIVRSRHTAEEGTDHHILEHAHVRERPHDLVSGCDASSADAICAYARDLRAVECDRAGVGRLDAGDQLEKRRLACAVGPDEPDDFPGGDMEINLRHRHEAAEAL
jgi:hypothetical protein